MTITDLKNLLDTKRQVFLTGAGGTGKSYTLNNLLPRYENPIKLATTNASAVLIGGDTVHSAFKLGTANCIPELQAEDNRYYAWFCENVNDDIQIAQKSRLKPIKEIFKNADLIVIDEISMLSASTFDLLFIRLEQCNITIPPLLMLGDLYQIPPVEVKDAVQPQKMIYHSSYFKPQIIELTEIKRTENLEFAKAQKSIRKGKYTEAVHNTLAIIQDNIFDKSFEPTILVSNNAQADKLNKQRLDSLKTPEHTFEAEIKTQINPKQVDSILRYMPPIKTLNLKIGARVMFITNDKEAGYYNGLQGNVKEFIVDEFSNDIIGVEVLADNNNLISVGRVAFDKKKLKTDSNGNVTYEVELTMKQIPLKVCYAMTIHKSQGASIKQLEIDCSRIFTAGQFYVAISRAIDPNLIRLRNFKPDYIRIKNEDLIAYMEAIKESIIQTPSINDDSIKVDI